MITTPTAPLSAGRLPSCHRDLQEVMPLTPLFSDVLTSDDIGLTVCLKDTKGERSILRAILNPYRACGEFNDSGFFAPVTKALRGSAQMTVLFAGLWQIRLKGDIRRKSSLAEILAKEGVMAEIPLQLDDGKIIAYAILRHSIEAINECARCDHFAVSSQVVATDGEMTIDLRGGFLKLYGGIPPMPIGTPVRG